MSARGTGTQALDRDLQLHGVSRVRAAAALVRPAAAHGRRGKARLRTVLGISEEGVLNKLQAWALFSYTRPNLHLLSK